MDITKGIANGTAVNVQTMVFGNMGNDSATGVVFTRNGQNGINEKLRVNICYQCARRRCSCWS